MDLRELRYSNMMDFSELIAFGEWQKQTEYIVQASGLSR